jgi:hypothetical protein
MRWVPLILVDWIAVGFLVGSAVGGLIARHQSPGHTTYLA